MDLLENPDVKSTYDKCKYVVKVWEHTFKKTHGRLPSKLDIREADKKVRDAYRQYYQLKTAALEQSFKDVDGFNSDGESRELTTDKCPSTSETSVNVALETEPNEPSEETWGFHLNKQSKKTTNKSNTDNSSLGKKIFCGSKLSKRYQRKSFSQKKSETSFDNSLSSQPSQSFVENVEDEKLSFEGIFSKSNVKVTTVSEKILTQPTNIIQSVLDNNYKALKSVDAGWLERVSASSGLKTGKPDDLSEYHDASSMCLDYNSDDIIDNSDEETVNLGHCAKKIKIDSTSDKETSKTTETPDVPKTEDPFQFKDDFCEVIKEKPKNKSKKVTKKVDQSVRKSSRSTKTQADMTESHSEDEDPFHSDNDLADPEFSPKKSKNKFNCSVRDISPPKTTKKTKKTSKKIEKNQPETENTDTTYELEYSIKPRVSAPRFKNLKKLIKIETTVPEKEKTESLVKTKREQQLEKLEKKIQSGSLNENFITINLKKKIYCRGKKTMTFGKFKKQQWKNKKKALAGPDMDMGGCDGGMLTCFTCGQTGHFARNCTKTKGDALLPMIADEEVCPFPTLEEAAQMAKDSHLTIRTPNVEFGKEVETEQQKSDSDCEIFDDAETEVMLAEVLKLEEHAAKLDLQNYVDQTKVVEAYYKSNEDGSVIDTPKEVFMALQNFGFTSFRPGQEQAVMRILSGKSTLVTLSTGSGKSLCYQLPAYLYSRREQCISLVISPLVSLMEDQITGIPFFLKAACLHTNQTKVQREKIMEAIASRELDVLLVSPEAVVAGERSSGFGSLLRKLPPIAFACIDEAHCVSQWSHNFRPSYLMICRVLRERMGVKTVLGLTATATRSTSDSIISHLEIPDGRAGIISDKPLPDNLILTVSKDYQRDQALLALLSSERFANCKSIIIYCTRREECERVTKFLRTNFRDNEPANKKRKRLSYQAEAYHAGLAASRRRTVQKAFMSGELRIVVATVAFGMGINKSDIRAVIHYNMPKNFESYVQEIGRAGRDGLTAHCHLFLDAKGNDENELRRHIFANSIDRHVIRKLLQKIFLPCSCKDTCPKHEVAFSIEETVRALDIPEENISTLLCYLELHEKKYIELLSPAYTVCKVISYGGPLQIRKAAKECPPLAMALALQKNEKNEQNVIEFAVIDIAAAIGWDSGICKHKLKNLEWATVNGQAKRTTLNVSFSNLGFRLLAPGNLADEQLDEALDSLYEHVVNQEKTALLQLRAVHQTLIEVAVPSYKQCLTEEPSELNTKLKTKIRDYFESPNPLEAISLKENQLVDEDLVVNNIRGLICTYRDNSFTGRAVARIFHGISSPNYPAVIWGRCKYWRCHINVDFHTICKLATKEILAYR
ncbi:ATP-dependent DNA helicase Q4 [Tribolium castaneum]|uniref:ATP-dependent DNA helicase Q4 n=1 Tax=Tribolium castaneum TaxID=7070 RepID=UPI0030FE2AFE